MFSRFSEWAHQIQEKAVVHRYSVFSMPSWIRCSPDSANELIRYKKKAVVHRCSVKNLYEKHRKIHKKHLSRSFLLMKLLFYSLYLYHTRNFGIGVFLGKGRFCKCFPVRFPVLLSSTSSEQLQNTGKRLPLDIIWGSLPLLFFWAFSNCFKISII